MNREVFETELMKRGFKFVEERVTEVGSQALWARERLELFVDMWVKGPSESYPKMLLDIDAHLEDEEDET